MVSAAVVCRLCNTAAPSRSPLLATTSCTWPVISTISLRREVRPRISCMAVSAPRSSGAAVADVLIPVAHPRGALLLQAVPVDGLRADLRADGAHALRQRVRGKVVARGKAKEVARG